MLSFKVSNERVVLRLIAEKVDCIVDEIESALCSSDINMICYRFEELKDAENELRCKSKEFNIDVRALDKRYEKIDNSRNRFLHLYDVFTDDVKRKSHLEALNEEEKSHGDNIILRHWEKTRSSKRSEESALPTVLLRWFCSTVPMKPGLSENIVIDGGMTHPMIYHGDNGWKLGKMLKR